MFREPEQEHYFSHPIFARIWGEWQDWQNGIPPGREWKARGAQNPRLLEAFRVLSAAQGQAEMEERSDAESRAHGLRQAQEFRKRVMG